MSKIKPILSDNFTVSSTTDDKRNIILNQPGRRILQNFLLVWLDGDLDESKENFVKYFRYLQRVIAHITTFKNVQECIDFLTGIKQEKIFMIVSGSLGQEITPKIEHLPQLESIYVFDCHKSHDKEWTQKFVKIKGVHKKMKPICNALRVDREKCDRDMVAISFNGIDVLFMYTQLLKETFLEIADDDAKSIKEFVEFCRARKDISDDQITEIERDYPSHTPIWWYTTPYFIYSMLNRGLGVMDTDIILKMGFFIRHLHNDISRLHREQQISSKNNNNDSFCVFRRQGVPLDTFEKMKKSNKGGLMSFNNFLSTSLNRDVSLNQFARPKALKKRNDAVGILFVMTIDPVLCEKSGIPYADVKDVSYFKGEEAEILFTTHTIFRIDYIEKIPDKETDRLWEVHLTLVGNDNNQMNELTSYLREEVSEKKGWSRLGEIFRRLGEPGKAKDLLHALLDNTSSNKDKANYCHQLGMMNDDLGEYSEALSYYEKTLELNTKLLPPNHPGLAMSYNNMATVYYNIGEYSKALSSYEFVVGTKNRLSSRCAFSNTS